MKIIQKTNPTYLIEMDELEIDEVIRLVERGLSSPRSYPNNPRGEKLLQGLIQRGQPSREWVDVNNPENRGKF